MAGSKSKFTEVARAACKGKVVAGAIGPPTKRACLAEEMTILPPLPAQPTVEESTHLQLESSALGAFAFALAYEFPAAIPIPFKLAPASMGVEASWAPSIQHVALVLNQVLSLLNDPSLVVLLIKNALRLRNRDRMNELKTDELFDNVIHFALESVLYAYVAKKHH